MLETVIGSSVVDGDPQPAAAGRRPGDARAHEPQADAARAGRRAAGGGADRAVRPARAQARAREPGPHRRRRRLRRRGAARDPHGAGVRPRAGGPRGTSARASRRRSRPRCAAIRQRALLVAAVIMLVFGAVGVILWIGGHDVLAGRLSRGRALGVRVLRGDRRERGRHDQRGDRRPAARRRRDRAAVRAARRRARDPRAGSIRCALAGAGARHGRLRRGDVPLSVAPRHAGARRRSRSSSRRASRWRWSARRARARRRCSSCCCASTIRRQARCRIDGVDVVARRPGGRARAGSRSCRRIP